MRGGRRTPKAWALSPGVALTRFYSPPAFSRSRSRSAAVCEFKIYGASNNE